MKALNVAFLLGVFGASIIGYALGRNHTVNTYIHCEGEKEQLMRTKAAYNQGLTEGHAACR